MIERAKRLEALDKILTTHANAIYNTVQDAIVTCGSIELESKSEPKQKQAIKDYLFLHFKDINIFEEEAKKDKYLKLRKLIQDIKEITILLENSPLHDMSEDEQAYLPKDLRDQYHFDNDLIVKLTECLKILEET